MSQRRRTKGGASRRQEPESTGSGVRTYSLGFVSGLFVAFMLYLVTLPPEETELPTPNPTASSASAQAPEYEFYEVLPAQRITVEVDPAELPQRNASSAKQYVLQAGSFRQAEDADRRRAELLLLGLEPSVEETTGDTGRWYRVVIGPFSSRSAMAKARSLTAQQDIDTLLVQRSPR